MKIAFVIPKEDDQHNPLNQRSQGRIFPPVGLARMVGIVGKQADVSLNDERLDHTHTVNNAQITIIFVNSYNQQRACDLARHYHDIGCLVVLTGPILSHSLELDHSAVDCLFIGAGEDNLADFLADYRSGKTRRFYRSEKSKTTSNQSGRNFENTALSLAS